MGVAAANKHSPEFFFVIHREIAYNSSIPPLRF